jgi:hypothetical protein
MLHRISPGTQFQPLRKFPFLYIYTSLDSTSEACITAVSSCVTVSNGVRRRNEVFSSLQYKRIIITSHRRNHQHNFHRRTLASRGRTKLQDYLQHEQKCRSRSSQPQQNCSIHRWIVPFQRSGTYVSLTDTNREMSMARDVFTIIRYSERLVHRVIHMDAFFFQL